MASGRNSQQLRGRAGPLNVVVYICECCYKEVCILCRIVPSHCARLIVVYDSFLSRLNFIFGCHHIQSGTVRQVVSIHSSSTSTEAALALTEVVVWQLLSIQMLDRTVYDVRVIVIERYHVAS